MMGEGGGCVEGGWGRGATATLHTTDTESRIDIRSRNIEHDNMT